VEATVKAQQAESKILVVDDEPGVRELLKDALSIAGFTVTVAEDGQRALTALRKEKVDLIIADVNMPHLDGYEMVSRMRDSGDQTPVIFLTARNDRSDVSHGLKVGADDYVMKPFGLEELTLRVAAILRRTKGAVEVERILKCGPILMDDEIHQVKFNEEIVELSPTEYRLLYFLIERSGKVVAKETLLGAIWGIEFETNTSVVDTYISYLRKKLHRDGYEGIKTIRGFGFQVMDH
jgi:two-component system OmpR family response regulator